MQRVRTYLYARIVNVNRYILPYSVILQDGFFSNMYTAFLSQRDRKVLYKGNEKGSSSLKTFFFHIEMGKCYKKTKKGDILSILFLNNTSSQCLESYFWDVPNFNIFCNFFLLYNMKIV